MAVPLLGWTTVYLSLPMLRSREAEMLRLQRRCDIASALARHYAEKDAFQEAADFQSYAIKLTADVERKSQMRDRLDYYHRRATQQSRNAETAPM